MISSLLSHFTLASIKQQAANKPPVSLFPISSPKFRHPHRQEELELRWKFLFTVETITEVDAADTW